MTSTPALSDSSPYTSAGTNMCEERMSRPMPRGWRSLGWYSFGLLVLYFACQICYAFGSSLLSPCLDEFASALHKDKGSLAASPTLSLLVSMMSSFLSGGLLDAIEGYCAKASSCRFLQRRVAHLILSLSLICLGVACFAVPFTPPSFLWFLVVQMVIGMFIAFVNVISTTLTIRVGAQAETNMMQRSILGTSGHTGAFTGACVSIVHVGVGAGGMLSPLAANLSFALSEKRMFAYMMLAPFVVVIVLGVSLLLPPPRLVDGDSDAVESVSVSIVSSVNEGRMIAKSLQGGHAIDRRSSVEYLHENTNGEQTGIAPTIVAVSPDKPFNLSIFITFLVSMMFAEGAIYGPTTYIVSVLHSLGFTEDNASLVFSAGSFGLAGGRVILSFIGPRFTPSQILLTMLPVALLFMFGQCFLVVTSLITRPGWPVVAFMICYVGNAVSCSCAYSWLLGLYSSRQTVNGMVNGMALVAISAGMVMCVNLDGYLYQHVGAKSFFIGNSCIGILGVLSVALFDLACRRAHSSHA